MVSCVWSDSVNPCRPRDRFHNAALKFFYSFRTGLKLLYDLINKSSVAILAQAQLSLRDLSLRDPCPEATRESARSVTRRPPTSASTTAAGNAVGRGALPTDTTDGEKREGMRASLGASSPDACGTRPASLRTRT